MAPGTPSPLIALRPFRSGMSRLTPPPAALVHFEFAQQLAQRANVMQRDGAVSQAEPSSLTPHPKVLVDAFADQPGHAAKLSLRQRETDAQSPLHRSRMQGREFQQRL